MTSSPGDAYERFVARFSDTNPPSIEGEVSAETLSRESIERFTASRTGTARSLESTGALRLRGEGVLGQRASAAEVGRVVTNLQSVVTSIGASLSGNKSRTRLPDELIDRTRLMVTGAPAPGSLIVNLTTGVPGFDEAFPAGTEDLFFPEQLSRPLVDEALETLARLLDSAELISTTAVTTSLRALGPRVAVGLKSFAQALAQGDFDAELTWDEPGKRRTRAAISAENARGLVAEITSNDLESSPGVIDGVVQTASSRKRLEVQGFLGSEEGLFRIRRGQLSDADLHAAAVFTHVRVAVQVTIEERPGGDPIPRYEAKSLEIVADSQAQTDIEE